MGRTLVGSAFLALAIAGPAAAGSVHFTVHSGPGVIAVSGIEPFDHSKGFGFEPKGAVVDAGIHCARPASTDPIAEADQATRFSVLVPEGGYHVTLHYRSAKHGTVMAEARRFMALPGAGRTLTFAVDVRNAALPALPLNAPGGTSVRLNPRECGSYSWDDKLTLAFPSADANRLASIDIAPVALPRLFVIGDSTVTDQPQAPYAGWGQMLPLFFGPDIIIANYGESGETLKSFLAELRLDKVLSEAKPGDWALIQFSHNDEKDQWPQTHAPAEFTFPLYLKVYIAELRRKGVQPVLVTPMQRLRFDAAGRIIETHGAYPAAIRAVAASENVPLIDLSAASKTLFETMGPDKAREAFAGHGADTTHQSADGALALARLVVVSIKQQQLPLTQYLSPGFPTVDSAAFKSE